MIKTTTVKIKKILDNLKIEEELSNIGYSNIIRWAIVEISENEMSVCVSHCNKNLTKVKKTEK